LNQNLLLSFFSCVVLCARRPVFYHFWSHHSAN
jgi:hypothetical protein